MLILPDIRHEKEQSWQKILGFQVHGPRKKNIFSTYAGMGDAPVGSVRICNCQIREVDKKKCFKNYLRSLTKLD